MSVEVRAALVVTGRMMIGKLLMSAQLRFVCFRQTRASRADDESYP